MAESVPLKYRAFISYSHADTAWAKWLQRGLEAFKIDKDLAGRETARGIIPETLRPIFRDREDFTAGEALPEQTLAALDASSAVVIVCSPHSAKSHYVNEEIRSFKSRHPDRPVIPLIVDGKPDERELECFPPPLKFKLDAKGRVTKKRVELLAADAREEGDGKDLALAKVIAGLLGLSSDAVFRRAERERRAAARRRRRVQIGVGALGFAVIVGGVGWLNEDHLRQAWHWYMTVVPYMKKEVHPYVLTAEAEGALKPGDVFRECHRACPQMVVVPRGKFTMGSPPYQKGSDREGPQHEVTFARQFAVSEYEVTFEDWDTCILYGGCKPISDNARGRGRKPVINVSWEHAMHYVAWLSNMTGKPYRLLSEAEWEYAARAGTQSAYFWGDEIGKNNAHCRDCASQWALVETAPVGSFGPNPWGIYDMHGNVWEWVEDCWHKNLEGAPDDGSVWAATSQCADRTLRGGSYLDGPGVLRSAYRGFESTGFHFGSLGFRVGRTLVP